jgi:hypothetical protein
MKSKSSDQQSLPKKRPGRKPGQKLGKKYIKIRRFVSEYMVDHNEVKAWGRCGYGSGNYQSDMVASRKVLERRDVKQLIAEAEEKRNEKTGLTAQMILDEYRLIAFADLSKIGSWDESGFRLKNSSQLTRDQIALISSMKSIPTREGIILEVKSVSPTEKMAALDALREMCGYKKKEGDTKESLPETARKLWEMQKIMKEQDGETIPLEEREQYKPKRKRAVA